MQLVVDQINFRVYDDQYIKVQQLNQLKDIHLIEYGLEAGSMLLYVDQVDDDAGVKVAVQEQVQVEGWCVPVVDLQEVGDRNWWWWWR